MTLCFYIDLDNQSSEKQVSYVWLKFSMASNLVYPGSLKISGYNHF